MTKAKGKHDHHKCCAEATNTCNSTYCLAAHENLAYCKACDAVYCKDCGRNWPAASAPQWNWTTTNVPVVSGGTVPDDVRLDMAHDHCQAAYA